jgi:hypothetical protein
MYLRRWTLRCVPERQSAQAERVRLAFKVLDSEGLAVVNLPSAASDAFEEMRERATSAFS